MPRAGVPVPVVPGLTSSLWVPAGSHSRDPPWRHPRVHGDLRTPAPRSPRLAGGLAGGRRDARDRGAHDGGPERAPDRAGARRRRSRGSTPVAVISDGTMPGHEMSRRPAGRLAATSRTAQVRPPGVIVVGEVVAVRSKASREGGRGRLSWAVRRSGSAWRCWRHASSQSSEQDDRRRRGRLARPRGPRGRGLEPHGREGEGPGRRLHHRRRVADRGGDRGGGRAQRALRAPAPRWRSPTSWWGRSAPTRSG